MSSLIKNNAQLVFTEGAEVDLSLLAVEIEEEIAGASILSDDELMNKLLSSFPVEEVEDDVDEIKDSLQDVTEDIFEIQGTGFDITVTEYGVNVGIESEGELEEYVEKCSKVLSNERITFEKDYNYLLRIENPGNLFDTPFSEVLGENFEVNMGLVDPDSSVRLNANYSNNVLEVQGPEDSLRELKEVIEDG